MKKHLPVVFTATLLAFFSSQLVTAQNTSPYWSLSGNSNATTSSKLGTTNDVALKFYTNNVQRMVIGRNTGNIGIGTNNPSGGRLHINSPFGVNAFLAQVGGNTKLLVHSGGGVSVGANVAPPTNGLYVSGNAGIGTASPISKLHVVGSSTAITASGGSMGLYAVSDGYDDNDIGVQGQGYGYGVIGSGYNYGVYATGLTAVYGRGENYGFYGESYSTGVYGRAGLGYGVYGTASTGVYGYGDDFGGDFSGFNDAGIRATTTYGSYAGAFYGPVYASGGFITSDKKFKNNIQEFGGALALIGQLKPRRYDFITDEKYAFLQLPKGLHYGLLAQDVEAVLPNLVSTANHEVRKPAAPPQPFKYGDKIAPVPSAGSPVLAKEQREIISIKAVNYTELIPILIKGIQELSKENEELKRKVEDIDQLKKQMAELKALVTGSNGGTVNLTSAYLEQNTPNPVNGTTTIRYHTPEASTSARLTLTNAKGQVVKTVNLGNRGIGQVNLNTAALAAGTYHYTLYVEDRPVDTKRFVVVH